MLTEREQRLNDILQSLAEALDIPVSKYTQAVERYKAVANWLNADDSHLHQYSPSIYPQGSFRLGTVVRPLKNGEEADYDIDLVAELQMDKEHTTPRRLKGLVGDRLRENAHYRRILDEEGRRCWTLNYAEEDGIGFHMDILPATPKGNSVILPGVLPKYAQHAIVITDKDKTSSLYSWSSSNPRGYALWFDDINRLILTEIKKREKKLLFERHRTIFKSIEQVPDQLVRTPLQRVIQILKRHRDMRFLGHKWEDEKPISMIITTLATRAYDNEHEVYTALRNIIDRIMDYAHTNLIQKRNGEWYIPNPVDLAENFADSWNNFGSNGANAFFKWMEWVKQDLAAALKRDSLTDIEKALVPCFGKRAINEAFSKYRKVSQTSGTTGTMALVGAHLPSRFDVPHREKPRWTERICYEVEIIAQASRKGFRTRNFSSDSRPLLKHFSLRFEARTNVPPPFEVYWQIVNTGDEAAQAGGLRGGFYNGEGNNGLLRKEKTLYTGMHWIECFIVKDDVCVARSGEFVVNIE